MNPIKPALPVRDLRAGIGAPDPCLLIDPEDRA
jgi:hypothetical protein